VHIQGVAYRGVYGAAQGIDPTTWTVPATVALYIGVQVISDAANLTQDTDGTIHVDVVFDETYRHWAQRRPYLWPILGGANADVVEGVQLVTGVPDSGLTPWTEVTP